MSDELIDELHRLQEALKKRNAELFDCNDELRKEWLERVKTKGCLCFDVPNALLYDRKFMLAAAKEGVKILNFAPRKICEDREIVFEAIKKGDCFALASRELRGDKEIVLEAIKHSPKFVLQYVSDELKGDKEVVLAVVRQYGDALEYASPELRADREVVLEAVKQNGFAMEYAADELKSDREFVLEAIKLDGWALYCPGIKFMDDELQRIANEHLS